MQPQQEIAKHAVDVLSFGVVAGTLMQWLPPLAAGLTVVWTLIRIWETKTVQRWVKRK